MVPMRALLVSFSIGQHKGKKNTYLPAAPFSWLLPCLLPLPRPLRPQKPLPRISSGPSLRCFWWGADLLDAPLAVLLPIVPPRCGPLFGGLLCWPFGGTVCQISPSFLKKGLLWWGSLAVVFVLPSSLSLSFFVELAGSWLSAEDKIQTLVP